MKGKAVLSESWRSPDENLTHSVACSFLFLFFSVLVSLLHLSLHHTHTTRQTDEGVCAPYD